MPATAIRQQSAKGALGRPEIRPGFTVRVHEKIQEGGKERTQVFEGLVIAVHSGKTSADATITVRKIASGIGVEKVFSLQSPKIEKIDVVKVAKVRRAKLFFLRGRRGKAARLSERFTTADEYSIAIGEEEEASQEEEGSAPAEVVVREETTEDGAEEKVLEEKAEKKEEK